jgi:TetR/AcrR family transcriptional repressor of nem operon
MKVTKEQAAASRERILDSASHLFRQRGLDGIGVAELMKSAGMTHGGFYGHFACKEDLMAQACERALAKSAERWDRVFAKSGGDALALLAAHYLSPEHRDNPGNGCAIAALGVDVSRQGSAVRRAYTHGLQGLLDRLTRFVPGRTRAAKRRHALATYASMVGGIVLARAVDDAALSDEILRAVAASIDARP